MIATRPAPDGGPAGPADPATDAGRATGPDRAAVTDGAAVTDSADAGAPSTRLPSTSSPSSVADERTRAEALGRALAELTTDPGAFAVALRGGLEALADPGYLEEQRRIAPGIGVTHGVRWPLLAAAERGFRRASHGEPRRYLFDIADRLFREGTLEERWFAFDLLDRAVRTDPVEAWQLLRRGAREAGDWITVDSLAHPYGRGILGEPYRWAELEQLVFSPSRWERRLVGSTIATIPFVDRRAGRDRSVASRAIPILAMLMGDDRPEVQKALAWALRSLVLADLEAVESLLVDETEVAVATGDGYRAWVVRDALTKVDPVLATRLRGRLAGIRRRPGAPATSRAASLAASFTGGAGLPDPAGYRERIP